MPDMGTTVGLINSLTAGVKEDVAGKLEAPSTAGTSGQVLVSDGNGGQVWGDIDAGEVVIDSTLSVAGAAADAAACGELKTQIDDLEEVAVIEAESEKSTYHNERDITKVTVYGNALAFGNVKLANKRNIIPNYPQTTMSQNGITCVQNGRFFKVTGETSGNVTFRFPTVPFEDVTAGDYTIMVVGSDSWTVASGSECYFEIYCYDSDGENQKLAAVYPYQNTNQRTYNRTINTGKNIAMSVNMVCKTGVNFGDGVTFFFGIYPQGYSVTDTGSTVASDASVDVNINAASYPNGVDTMMHESIATYHPTVKQYVDEHDVYGELGYTLPEAFGAKGDGYTDDTSAVSACITYAIANNVPVRGYGKYLITTPIDIAGDKLDIYLFKIIYTGSNYAIGYQGKNSTINIQHIDSSGVGVYINATTATTLYNAFTFNAITATKDGVQIYANYNCYQNRLVFEKINAGASYCCILITRAANTETGYISEWNIVGGMLTGGLWGIKGIMNDAMKFDVHTEGLGSDGNGGAFYSTNGQIPSIMYARTGEIVMHNTYLKLAGTYEVQGVPFLFPSRITLQSIDISDLTGSYNSENAALITDLSVQTEAQSNVLLTKHLTLWVNRFQFPQHAYKVLEVTEDLDMTDQYYNGIIPQKIIADNVVADINLHPTYAANCLNNFVVEQKNDGEIDIYDCVGNLIFDGSEQGNGVFNLTAYVVGNNALKFDLSNQAWDIQKIS